ncbi:MAG TPA: alpha-ketoacid dehydrogenase subunit beta, partial [Myxococcota bacterium]|nr:alpha-ketoacid dehydrogenase subunit beta [Myxococcota bacterium]
EIAAGLAEQALDRLLAPIERVTGWDTIVPFPRLEDHDLPSTPRIVDAARRTLDHV